MRRPPDSRAGRPRTGRPATQATGKALDAYIVASGCPCGCTSKPPWIDDPDCARHRPLPTPVDWADYDVFELGLVSHDRTGCAACLAVGA